MNRFIPKKIVKSTIFLTFMLIFCSSGFVLGQDATLTILKKPSPKYTDIARQNTVIGVVRLRVTFKSDGTIGNIAVVNALPFGLTEQAIYAARLITFELKMTESAAKSVTKTVEYRFDIYTDEDDKDLKKKAKIRKGPIFDFTIAEKAELKRLSVKINISLGGDGVVSLYSVEPAIAPQLHSKIQKAVEAIVFEPALLKGGKPITVSRILKL